MRKPKPFNCVWHLSWSLVMLFGILVAFSSSSAHAQDADTPTPFAATAVITPQNAAQVKYLARFGNGTVEGLMWSPTGDTLAVTGSLGLWLYDAHNLSSQPRLLDMSFPTTPHSGPYWSPDGRLLAFLEADNTIHLRAISDMALSRTFSEFPAEVLAFTFGSDSQTLITMSADKMLRTWGITTGDLLQTLVLEANDLDVKEIEAGRLSFFFSDARTLVALTTSYSSNAFLHLYDVATGKLRQTLKGYDPGQEFLCMAFSADGNTLAIERQGYLGPDLWDLPSGQEIYSDNEWWNGLCSGMAFSPDGENLLISRAPLHWSWAGYGPSLWDVQTHHYIHLEHELSGIQHIALSSDGKWLAATLLNGAIQISDVSTGTILQTIAQHEASRAGRTFALVGKTVVSVNEFGQVLKVDLSSGQVFYDNMTSTVWNGITLLSHDGKTVAGCEVDRGWFPVFVNQLGTNQSYTLKSGKLICGLGMIGFSPDDKILMVEDWDHNLTLWDTVTGKLLNTLTVNDKTAASSASDLEPDGSKIRWVSVLSESTDAQLLRFTHTGHLPARLLGGPSSIQAAAFSPNSQELAVNSAAPNDTDIQLWDVPTGHLLRVLGGQGGKPDQIRFSPNGLVLASTSGTNAVSLWDVPTGRLLRVLTRYSGQNAAMAFGPDSQNFAFVTVDGKSISLQDVTRGNLIQTFDPQRYGSNIGIPTRIMLSPSGQILASLNADNTISLWETATGALLQTLHSQGPSSWFLNFSSDGTSLVSASNDGTIQVWGVPAMP